MNNLLKIYNRIYSFAAYNLLLYANFILLFIFLLNIKSVLIIPLSIKLLSAYFLGGIGGYFINDLFDQKADKLVNKFNITTIINQYLLSFVILLVWTVAFFLIYSISKKASFFLIIQYLMLFLYSVPFFRFKEKGILGLVTDAFYAHVIPEIILLLIIQVYAEISYLYWISFLFFTFSLGMRDILIHQLEDFKKDTISNTHTFAIKKIIQAKNYVKRFENMAVISLISFIAIILIQNFSILFLLLFIVLLISYIVVIVKDKSLIKDALIRNYVIVSSICFSYLMIINDNYFGLILLIHPYFISFIFKTDIPLFVNYVLYYFFLLFGRNLKERPLYKKSNTPFFSKISGK